MYEYTYVGGMFHRESDFIVANIALVTYSIILSFPIQSTLKNFLEIL